jgi:uncharacterized protein with PIN domain
MKLLTTSGQLTDIICNKCGASLRHKNLASILLEVDVYDVNNTCTFSLCENCLKIIFSTFAWPINKKEYYA